MFLKKLFGIKPKKSREEETFKAQNQDTTSEEWILAQLDSCTEDYYTFPMLDHGHVYLVESRLSVYRDETRWRIIIEIVGFNYRYPLDGHARIRNFFHEFGNCFDHYTNTTDDSIQFTDDSDEGDIFDAENGEYLNPGIKSILLRDKKISVTHNPEHYKQKGIDLGDSTKIHIADFLRSLTPKYRTDMLATEEELRGRLPNDLPLFLRLDEWHHIDYGKDEKPSECETFQMIAKAISSGDPKYYKPTLEPNNHWKNWPEGGSC